MPGNSRKEDIRTHKTHNVLIVAMSKLLERRNFTQITVKDLCEEAQIGRSTFYSHFNDKYELLKYWLTTLKVSTITNKMTYNEIEKNVNDFVINNKKVIRNLIVNANNETYQQLCDFIFTQLDIKSDNSDNVHMNQSKIILSNFCSGGLMNYLFWQVENKFPSSFPFMNPYLYEAIMNIQKWNIGQE